MRNIIITLCWFTYNVYRSDEKQNEHAQKPALMSLLCKSVFSNTISLHCVFAYRKDEVTMYQPLIRNVGQKMFAADLRCCLFLQRLVQLGSLVEGDHKTFHLSHHWRAKSNKSKIHHSFLDLAR